MIKISISHKILEKHRKYVINESNIKESLEKFLMEDYFLDESYLDKLLTFSVKSELNNSLIRELQNELERELSKREKSLTRLQYLNDRNKSFIEFLLHNVNSLMKCDLEKCKCNNIRYRCINIFLAEPKEINWIQENIVDKEHKIISIIFQLESYINTKEKKEIENKYSEVILDIFGYNTFSSKQIRVFYKKEYNFLISISNCKFYNDYLNKYSIPEKKEATKGNPVSTETLNSIRDKLLSEIEELKNSCGQYSEFYCLLNDLYVKLDTLVLSKDSGESIGRKSFIKSINEKAYVALDEIEDKKISKEEVITLYNIEDYSEEYGSSWSAYMFVMELGVQTCPYCNRQYISPIYSSEGKLRADLDHFLPKYIYPYFSMSIFNLVPSCKFCNSSLKGTANFSYNNNINPYEQGFDDILKFTYKIKSYDASMTTDAFDIKLEEHWVTKEEENIAIKAKKNANVFQVENLYNYHKREVLNLIKKRIVYTEEYIDTLRRQHKNLFNSDIEVLEFIIGNYLEINNLDKQPLSKLTQDICEELGFIRGNISNDNLSKLKSLLKQLR